MVEEGKEGRKGGIDAAMPKGDGDFHCDSGRQGLRERESKCAPSSSFVFASRGTDGRTNGKERREQE